MPFLSCILLSHAKAAHVGEALDSLIAQTFHDWEAVVFDSGVLHDQGFFSTLSAMKDPRIRLVRSWETAEIRRSKTIASWCFNECFRKKLLSGQYITYLCDDDLYYPNAFAAFHAHATANPQVMAMYASVDMTALSETREKVLLRELIADEMKGSCRGGGPLDCHVDYLQLCHKASLYDLFAEDEFWPEDRQVMQHADGIFLEKIGSRVPIYPVAVKIGENRKVPLSLNTGGERLQLLLEVNRREREIQRLEQLIAQQRQLLAAQQELLLRSGPRSDCLRYRVADQCNAALKRIPAFHGLGKKLVLASWRAWQRATRQRV
jgi:glycosyltransferase involved in cell wall biosynthesis